MKKGDVILIAALLLAAGLGFLFFAGKKGGEAQYVVARVDGKEVGRWSLAEETETDVDSDLGHNRIRIRDGSAVMIEADCPDGYCMGQKEIGADGGSIICLPHHLVVETVDEKGKQTLNDGVDAIAE